MRHLTKINSEVSWLKTVVSQDTDHFIFEESWRMETMPENLNWANIVPICKKKAAETIDSCLRPVSTVTRNTGSAAMLPGFRQWNWTQDSPFCLSISIQKGNKTTSLMGAAGLSELRHIKHLEHWWYQVLRKCSSYHQCGRQQNAAAHALNSTVNGHH